ncbi:MAG: hypothetical protein WCS99_05990 [Limisphaerales bacterium]
MSTIEEIKSAVSKVSLRERRELQRWLTDINEGERWTKETLKQAVQVGIDDLEQGRFKEYDEASLAEGFAGMKQRGRERLAAAKSAQT